MSDRCASLSDAPSGSGTSWRWGVPSLSWVLQGYLACLSSGIRDLASRLFAAKQCPVEAAERKAEEAR
jgi:hypothetical protein